MHEAVSNSSTLIHLSAIGYLKLLKKFHGKIIIPQKISSLKKELDKLQSESNFWIDKKLYNKVLESVGEKI